MKKIILVGLLLTSICFAGLFERLNVSVAKSGSGWVVTNSLASGGGGSSAVETTNIVNGMTADSLTITNLTTVEPINDFAYSNFKVGFRAGNNSYTSNSVFLGYSAGSSAKGIRGSYLGFNAGRDANGNNNSYLGYAAGQYADGNNNSYLGYTAGYYANGDYNNYLGYAAGLLAVGNSNSYLGYRAGRNSISTNNLYLGFNAGEYQTNENKAYFGNYTTIDVNTAKVVNVTTGTDSMDAVNVEQLNSATNAVVNAFTTIGTQPFIDFTNALKQAGVF